MNDLLDNLIFDEPKLYVELGKLRGLKGDTGPAGKDGVDGVNGIDGEDGDRGPRGFAGEDGKDGKDGKDGRDGKDLSETYVKNVIKSLDKKIDDGLVKVDGRFKMVDMRWHGGGLSRVSTDSSLTGNGTASSPLSVASGFVVVTTASAINDSNLVFIFTSAPTLICINGAFYQQTGGAITWSVAGTTITLSAPVGTGGSIFGIK